MTEAALNTWLLRFSRVLSFLKIDETETHIVMTVQNPENRQFSYTTKLQNEYKSCDTLRAFKREVNELARDLGGLIVPTTTSTVTIDYTNYRNERSTYQIIPIGIKFASSEYHPERQWMLDALKVMPDGTMEPRAFAMRDIHSWKGE